MTSAKSSPPFIVSAPGKVIIFGEHSAVYNQPAIAAALNLRCYLLVTPNENDDQITLEFPDIQLNHTWNKSDIPFDDIKSLVRVEDGRPKVTEELVPEITNMLGPLLEGIPSKMHHTACFCFLYLYCNLVSQETPGMKFIVRSTLPIGAGLGSSASTAVCLASALAILGNWVTRATYSHEELSTNNAQELEFIDQWSLIGEKCFHGNPSGIDNAVATYGGAVMFQRVDNQPSKRTNIRNFPELELLLTNTTVPRSTANLVGGVGELTKKYPKIFHDILNSMGNLSLEAYDIMTKTTHPEKLQQTLHDLFNINHGLLVALGVSHPALEQVKLIGDKFNVGATKLTGAGGGGCAITLVNPGVDTTKLHQAMDEFKTLGFECFDTLLGGKGVGALYYDDDVANLFSKDLFCGYKHRQEIEYALGIANVNQWRFW
ncbi:Mevalonate kinase [Spathaspora sp. JA1]|nr:Mevalonate kinase [Spathaspora sp. JA1]